MKNCWNKVNQEFSFGLNEFTPGQKFYSCSGNFGVKLGIFLFLFLSPTDNDDINTCVNNENDDNNNKDNEKQARKPRSYASPKLRLTYLPTY